MSAAGTRRLFRAPRRSLALEHPAPGLRYREHHVSVRHRCQDLVLQLLREQCRTLGLAARAEIACPCPAEALAEEGGTKRRPGAHPCTSGSAGVRSPRTAARSRDTLPRCATPRGAADRRGARSGARGCGRTHRNGARTADKAPCARDGGGGRPPPARAQTARTPGRDAATPARRSGLQVQARTHPHLDGKRTPLHSADREPLARRPLSLRNLCVRHSPRPLN